MSLFNEHALLGLGLMLSAGEIPRIAGAFGLGHIDQRESVQRSLYGADGDQHHKNRRKGGCGMSELTMGSLFDGIGVFPLAASRHGIVPVWASEIVPDAISITKRHFPEMVHLGDITALSGGKIPAVDVITFGSPCQNFSQIGDKSGIKWRKIQPVLSGNSYY